MNSSLWQLDKSVGHYLAFVFCCRPTMELRLTSSDKLCLARPSQIKWQISHKVRSVPSSPIQSLCSKIENIWFMVWKSLSNYKNDMSLWYMPPKSKVSSYFLASYKWWKSSNKCRFETMCTISECYCPKRKDASNVCQLLLGKLQRDGPWSFAIFISARGSRKRGFKNCNM